MKISKDRERKSPDTSGDAVHKPARRKVWHVVLPILLCVLLVGGALTWIGIALGSDARFSYTRSDLSRYLSMTDADYMNHTYTVTLAPVTDREVEEKILSLRAAHKSTSALFDGAYLTDHTIDAGDVVTIYYRGYQIGQTGERTYPSGTCNFSGSAADLTIGSGSFVSGFESGLVGKNPADYTRIEFRREGEVLAGWDLCFSGTVYLPDGTVRSYSECRLNASEDADALYGKGFREKLMTLTVGQTAPVFTLDDGEESTLWSGLSVRYLVRGDGEPITVTTHFPAHYEEVSLRNQTIYFDVYVLHTVAYAAPAYDDAFVRDTLKVSEQTLASYAGETPALQYRSLLRASLMEEYEENKIALLEEAFFDYMKEKVTVRSLPGREVDRVYRNYLNTLQQAYNSYGAQYDSLSSFATIYYKLDGTQSYEAYLRSESERVVTEQLIFYSVMRQEKLSPTEEELATRREKLVEERLSYFADYYGYKRERYSSDEAYKAAIAGLKEQMMAYYTEAYFDETALYLWVMDTLCARLHVQVLSPA